jgi:hypothetical protein
MKLEKVVVIALISRFALSFLWFAVEYGQKGRCHGQLDERRPQFCCWNKSVNFGLLTCQFELAFEPKL